MRMRRNPATDCETAREFPAEPCETTSPQDWSELGQWILAEARRRAAQDLRQTQAAASKSAAPRAEDRA